jgi:hypothetical protein
MRRPVATWRSAIAWWSAREDISQRKTPKRGSHRGEIAPKLLEHCAQPALDLCGERPRRTPRLRLLVNGQFLYREPEAPRTNFGVGRISMATKGRLSKAADGAKVLAGAATRRLRRSGNAARAVAGAALGAAAIAATGVLAKKVADAIREGGEQVGQATPHLQRMATRTVSQRVPRRRKRAAAAPQPQSPKNKTGSAKGSRKRVRASRGRR